MNIDWDRKRLTAYASKTESSRVVPITADIMPILQEASDAAPEGAVNVVPLTSHRSKLHRKLETIIQLAGLVPWDDLMQTLHRSAEPDFASPPQHAVSKWIGHSMAVSERQYLQVTDDLIAAAVNAPKLASQGGADFGAVTVSNSMQVQETRRNGDFSSAPISTVKECDKPLKTGAFVSSKSGTRTRDPRLMKPVADEDGDGATTSVPIELGNWTETALNCAQQKAQHFGCVVDQTNETETEISRSSGLKTDQGRCDSIPPRQLSPELIRVIESWSNLPDPVRESILLLVGQFGRK